MPMREWPKTADPLSPSGDSADAPAIRWQMSAAGECTWLSPEWEAVTRQRTDDGIGRGWVDHLHPDDRARVRDAWDRAQTSGSFAVDLRIRVTGESQRWFRARAVPLDGQAAGWSGVAIDISDLNRAIADERAVLHHRIRNTLAVIRSMARRTAETSETVDEYRSHFDGRLAAFSRTQSHVMRSGGGGVDLEGLLADELLAHHAGGRVSYAGPEVRLSSRLADQLGVALHELTTNAVQHGALRPGDGRVAVGWRVTSEGTIQRLDLDWDEEVPEGGIVAPPGYGFGLELLTCGLAYELDADVRIDFPRHGLRCRIALPLSGEWPMGEKNDRIDPIERRA